MLGSKCKNTTILDSNTESTLVISHCVLYLITKMYIHQNNISLKQIF